MDAKITVTSKCNAKCKTCPVWCYDSETMSFADFKIIFDKLNESKLITRILLNNTGDLYNIENNISYLLYAEQNRKKAVLMTTNAELMDYIPAIDGLIISFNGGNKESYEYTTGLNFNKVVNKIKSKYNELSLIHDLQLHCLIWEGNKGSEEELKELWQDFPGRVRVSYKYDNQFKSDKTIDMYKDNNRIFCNYLTTLSIMPDGQIISCAHDFKKETNYGNILYQSVEDLFRNEKRKSKILEHNNCEWLGLCKDCNYNVTDIAKVFYIK